MSAAYLMRNMQKRGGRPREYVKAEDLAVGGSEQQLRAEAAKLRKEYSEVRRKRSRLSLAAATDDGLCRPCRRIGC